MKKYSEFLYDDIGNPHVRKNLYLKELAEEKSEKVVQKKNHPYYRELNDYKNKEKEFEIRLKELEKKEATLLVTIPSKKIRALRLAYFVAQQKVEFYKSYQDLSYDAEYEYKKAVIETEQYPMIIEHYRSNYEDLQKAIQDKKHIDLEKNDKIKQEIEEYKKVKKAELDQGKAAFQA